MAELRRGHIVAKGSDAFCALVGLALDECDQPIENLPLRTYTIEEHTPAEFRDAGYVITATGDTAEGYVASRDTLWLNSRVVANKPRRARHIVRHEVAHVIPLTAAKRQALMGLMVNANLEHPTDWRAGSYLDRPSESFADTFAEAVSGIDSPWDDFAFYRLDVDDGLLPKFVTIALAPDPTPPVEPPPPDPLPPVDPIIAVLRAANAQLTEQLAEAEEAATTLGTALGIAEATLEGIAEDADAIKVKAQTKVMD